MAIYIEPASDQHDEAITELFTSVEVPIKPLFWERAFGSGDHGVPPSIPMIARLDEDMLLGFLAVKPIELMIESSVVKAQIIHDFVMREGPSTKDALALLMKDIAGFASVSLVAGAGIGLSLIAEQAHMQLAGFFGRYHFDWRSKPPKDVAKPAVLSRIGNFEDQIEELNEKFSKERKIFRRRLAANLNWQFFGPATGFEVYEAKEFPGYLVLRRETGLTEEGTEFQLVDICASSENAPRLLSGLAELSRSQEKCIFASVFSKAWHPIFQANGFESLRPRWPLHWILSDARNTSLSSGLLEHDSFFFTAADGEIDHW